MNKLTTKDLTKILGLCDIYFQKKHNTTIFDIMALDIDNKPELIMVLLMTIDLNENEEVKKIHETIIQYINNCGLYNILFDSFDSLSKKKILEISEETLRLSSRKPGEVPALTTLGINEIHLRKIFEALKHNVDLYEELYKDKIWIVNSESTDQSCIRSEQISISPARFFHMLGFEEKHIKSNMEEFLKAFKDSSKAKALLTTEKRSKGEGCLLLLYEFIKNEERIIEAALSGDLKESINIPKIEMKNYSFERLGMLEHSSGMIFFDKELALSKGYAGAKHLQSNLILLNEFIKKYDVDFVFSAYRPYPFSKPVLDCESLILTQTGGKNSMCLDEQKLSISQSVGMYKENDFRYTIRSKNGQEIPFSDPKEYIEFSEEEKLRVTESIIEEFPSLKK